MYALVDCNNFYVSCERLFRPELRGLPVELLRDGPEDNVATLITHWYMAHKKHSVASDLVAEDLIELAQRVTGQQ